MSLFIVSFLLPWRLNPVKPQSQILKHASQLMCNTKTIPYLDTSCLKAGF